MEESRRLEKNMKKVDEMRKRTDEMLYQFIPKGIARMLRDGASAIETIQAYDAVSICFTKVVNFGAKCMKISAHQMVELLNQMYTLFDALTELHKVYKVETVGDNYMLASGEPHHTPMHAAHITEMVLQILETARNKLYWPQKSSGTKKEKGNLPRSMEPLQFLIGCHSGPVVAGVVGYKRPRYCLFGDTVNTASRMMSSGSPDQIHISQSFADALSPYPYVFKYRGKMSIKGKGEMETYFIEGRAEEFSVVDEITGLRRVFTDVLKEDYDESYTPESDQPESGESMSVELPDTDSESSDLTLDSCASKKRLPKLSEFGGKHDEGVQRSDGVWPTVSTNSSELMSAPESLMPPDRMNFYPGHRGQHRSTPSKLKRTSTVVDADRRRKLGLASCLVVANKVPETENVLRQVAVRLVDDVAENEMQRGPTCEEQNKCPPEIVLETDSIEDAHGITSYRSRMDTAV